MAVVDPRYVVKVGVLEKWEPVYGVHCSCQTRKGEERCCGENNMILVNEMAKAIKERGPSWRSCLKVQNKGWCVDEWVDLKMYRQAQQNPSERDPSVNHSPQQRCDHDTKQPF